MAKQRVRGVRAFSMLSLSNQGKSVPAALLAAASILKAEKVNITFPFLIFIVCNTGSFSKKCQ